MLTADLKKNTYPEHQAAEKKMILALKKLETQEDYIRMLSWLYSFYAPLEDRIRQYVTEDTLPDITKRCRAGYILEDIKQSGETAGEIGEITANKITSAPEKDLPIIDSADRALGALYVLEGSTLGGRIIAGMITRQLGPTAGNSYFNSYGAETENMWQSFKDFLDQPRSAEQQAAIIDAAKETFITFKNWIDKHELQPQL